MQITVSNEQDTQEFAKRLAKLPITGSVWLSGELGVGKTTLTRYWLQALGHQGSVKSPTYTLVEPYRIMQNNSTIKSVYHADLYRLQDPEELEFIGFSEYYDEPNVLIIIEWASRAKQHLPEPVLLISIHRKTNENREISLTVTTAGKKIGLDIQLINLFHSSI